MTNPIHKTRAKAISAVRFNKSLGLLTTRSIEVANCTCCGDIHVIGYDEIGRPFVLMPISAEIALKLADALVTAADTSREIEARNDDTGRAH
jgi:hypothetical protein